MEKIINSISKQIMKDYPDTTQYIQKVPKGFKRPSFFVKFVDVNRGDLSHDHYMDTFIFNIVYFANRNDYRVADKLEQLRELGKLLNLFDKSIPIENSDRYAKIENLSGNIVDEELRVSFDLKLSGDIDYNLPDRMLMGELVINE
ncbi:MAG: hypothetical protein AWU54_1198 [Candidatus Frackibacter sp. T328-2]|jgi:hypothetical protein|nr:MAG: hypothetical protein AWU54_1198 [Candidatus Frackibacter sp. T328-2]